MRPTSSDSITSLQGYELPGGWVILRRGGREEVGGNDGDVVGWMDEDGLNDGCGEGRFVGLQVGWAEVDGLLDSVGLPDGYAVGS